MQGLDRPRIPPYLEEWNGVMGLNWTVGSPNDNYY